QTIRLETAGTGVAEQIQSVEEGLGQQRAALVTAAYALRTDQEDFSAQVESQRAQLLDHLSQTRTAADDLNLKGEEAANAIKAQVEAVVDQYQALVQMSQREADSFDHATKLALDRFEALSADSRDLLVEETRRALEALQATADAQRQAAEKAIEQAQIRADRLGESLFDAAQQADAAAEARIEGARRIIGQTAEMVDQTGERLIDSLQATLTRVTEALSQVEQAVADMDERASRLPLEAQSRVESVRAAVENGLTALSAASRKAAEDTEALESGFQERVRRNYDMLTEAVRLMGAVSGEGGRRRPLSQAAMSERSPEQPQDGLRGRLRPQAAPERDIEAIPAAPPVRTAQPPRDTTPAAPPLRDAPAADLDWSDLTASGPALAATSPAPIGSPDEIDALASRITDA